MALSRLAQNRNGGENIAAMLEWLAQMLCFTRLGIL